jgi:hypothetical protein
MPGQDAASRSKRGAAISSSRQASKKWKEENPGIRGDPMVFRETIHPGLAGVRLTEIMEACGVSKATASKVRAGKQVPAVRHWDALRILIETREANRLN